MPSLTFTKQIKMLVLGKDFTFLLNIAGEWVPYLCARSGSLNVTTSFIETSIKGTGNFKTFKPTFDEWDGNIDGLVSLGDGFGLPDLRQLQLSHTPLLIRFQRQDLLGVNTYSDEGYAYISNTSDTGSFDNVATYTAAIKGTGPLTQFFTPVSIGSNVMRYEYQGIGGEDGFTDPALANKRIIYADKGGTGRAKLLLIGTPDPATLEMLYVQATGQFKFAQPFETNEYAVILYTDL